MVKKTLLHKHIKLQREPLEFYIWWLIWYATIRVDRILICAILAPSSEPPANMEGFEMKGPVSDEGI
jgi:hypothetical protein